MICSMLSFLGLPTGCIFGFVLISLALPGIAEMGEPIQFVHLSNEQPKSLDFLKWMFGEINGTNKGNSAVTVHNSSANVTTTSSPVFPIRTNGTAEIRTSENGSTTNYGLRHLPSSHAPATNGTATNNSSSNERAGKQMYPGGFYPMPIYTWPWNNMQLPMFTPYYQQPPRRINHRQQRPVFNVYEQEGSNGFGSEADMDEVDEDAAYDAMIRDLKEARRRHQIDRVAVVELESYENTSGEKEVTSSKEGIEDYDTAVDAAGSSEDENERRKTRSVEAAVDDAETGCEGGGCSHDQVLDRRRPSSRGRIGSDSTHIPILSPFGTVNVTSTPASSFPSPSTHGATTASALTALPNLAVVSSSSQLPSPSAASSSKPPANDTLSTTSTTIANLNFTATPDSGATVTTETTDSSAPSSFTPSQAPAETSTNPVQNISEVMISNSTEGTTVRPMPSISAVLNCQCGVQSVSTEQAGSTLVRVMTHPWIVEILSRASHACAGSLINDYYVLTAASCIHSYKKRELKIVTGLQFRDSRRFGVSKIAIHPKFNTSSLGNNVALLRLSERVKSSHDLRPICLPIQPAKYEPHTAQLVTWVLRGKKQGKQTLQLLHSELELLSETECQETLNAATLDELTLTNGTVCAGPPGQRICGGDVGGVLQVYAGKYSYEQIGLVSKSVGCRTSETPGVYTDIRQYLRWILFQTQDANYCREPNAGSFASNN